MQFNHTLIWCSDREASSRFLADLLGRPAPVRSGPFEVVELDNGVSLAFMATPDAVQAQHYAFLVSEAEFDAVMQRIHDRRLPYWADPYHRRPNTINHGDGGRGVYFVDPDGHDLEVITQPYGH